MVDILLLSYTYFFLSYLVSKRNFGLSKIKLKSFDTFSNRTNSIYYETYDQFYNTYYNLIPSYLSYSDFAKFIEYYDKPNTKGYEEIYNKFSSVCGNGPYLFVDNVLIENKNLPFYCYFNVQNVSNNITIQDRIEWNSYKTAFYENEVVRYHSLILEEFSTYKKNWNIISVFRDNYYVNNCYVDFDFVN